VRRFRFGRIAAALAALYLAAVAIQRLLIMAYPGAGDKEIVYRK
jgi:hypothetical protein